MLPVPRLLPIFYRDPPSYGLRNRVTGLQISRSGRGREEAAVPAQHHGGVHVAIDNTVSVLEGRNHTTNASVQCRGGLVALLKYRDRYLYPRTRGGGGGRGVRS